MKQSFLITSEKLKTGLTWLKLIDRDRGQLDHYGEGGPGVPFPCALLKISMPKRKNLTVGGTKQMRGVTITVRVAFERLYDSSSINTNAASRLKAMEYYDRCEEVDELLQGFKDAYFNSPFECTATIDEERQDMDVVRFTFSTMVVK